MVQTALTGAGQLLLANTKLITPALVSLHVKLGTHCAESELALNRIDKNKVEKRKVIFFMIIYFERSYEIYL